MIVLNDWIIKSDVPERGHKDDPTLHPESPRELKALLEHSPEQELTPILERLLSLDTKADMGNAWHRFRDLGMVASERKSLEDIFLPPIQPKTPAAIFCQILHIRQDWKLNLVVLHQKRNKRIPALLKDFERMSAELRELDLDLPEQVIANGARLHIGKLERGTFSLDPKDRANQVEQFPQTSFADLLDFYRQSLNPDIVREANEPFIALKKPVVKTIGGQDRHFYRLFAGFLNDEFQSQSKSLIAAFGSAVFNKEVDERTVRDSLKSHL